MVRHSVVVKFVFFVLFWTLVSCFMQPESGDITIGHTDTIYSDILGENRKLWVHVPESGDRYPVIYLLDGSSHFRSVVGIMHQLSSANGNTVCPRMIVVGILNTDRSRDLTPSKGDIRHPYVDSRLYEKSGGGDRFLRFVEKELFPHIESTYPTRPYRIFIGHSYGGLTVLHTLFHHPDLFNACIAVEPSLWWGDQKLLKHIKRLPADKKLMGKSLYLGIGNTLRAGTDLTGVMTDTSYGTMHFRSLMAFKDIIEDKYKNILRFQSSFYPSDDHISVPLISEYDGLRFIFDFYKFRFHKDDRKDPSIDLFGRIRKHYENVSRYMGYPVKPSVSLVNSLGYHYLINEQFEKAEKYFKMNVANFPGSYRCYDACGDYFNAVGNTGDAVKYYKKSLLLNSRSPSKSKLEKIRKERGTGNAP